MKKLKKPAEFGEVWIHIDRLTRRDGRVWAVQERPKAGGAWNYYAVTGVLVKVPLSTVSCATSPRAYLVAHDAKVNLLGSVAEIVPA